MKTLTIFRHAKSSWDEQGLADFDRPLSQRGRTDAPVMAERLQEARIRPSLILSSPAMRAWKSARMVAKQISYPVEFLQREPGLYLADVQKLLDIIAAQDEGFNNIMIIGHNPGLTELANLLVPGVTRNIPTAGFVALRIDSSDWDLRTRKGVELIRYDFPKNARQVHGPA